MKLEDKKAKAVGGGATIIFNVLGIIFALCLIGSVIRLAFGFSNITFSSLLEYISNAPSLYIQFYVMSFVSSDWGAFNFLRDIWNNLAYFWSFVSWFGIHAFNGIRYLFYFLRFMFV